MANVKSFIHGNAIFAERAGASVFHAVDGIEGTDTLGLPTVWGKIYEGPGGLTNWFHAVIPTFPVIFSSLVQLEAVFIFFKTSGSCSIGELQFWDGTDRINRVPSLTLAGNYPHDPVPGITAFEVREEGTGITHTMNYGLNLGIQVNFSERSQIVFYSAGASFITSD